MSVAITSCRLGDVINLKRGYDLAKQQRVAGQVPIISSSGITDYHNIAKVRGPGVITGRYGTLGAVFYVEEDYWPLNTSLYVQDFKGNEPRFISYFLQTLNLGSQNSAGAVPGVNRNHLHELEVHLPDLPTQRRIAGILSAYDDLIENNLRRIRILEEMAQSLYREWFVHFRFPHDRSEASAKAGGHESAKFKDSELGRIPEAWEVVPLSEIINVTHGYAFKGENFSKEPTSRILTTPGNFRVGGGIKYDKLKFYGEEAAIKAGYVFDPMDLMLTMTDLSKTGDTLGYPAFVPKLKGLTFLHNQRIGRVVPVVESFPKHFLHCLFCDDRYRHHIVSRATGLAVKHTSPSRILSFSTALPTTGTLIDDFDCRAELLFRRVNVLIASLENLKQTRDLLLPKLLTPSTYAEK